MAEESLVTKPTLAQFVLTLFKRFRVLNFMVVGGIGYVVNMGLYYPLTLVFKTEVTFLGSHFYLPPFVISSCVAIVCNYLMNKKWTFGDRKAKSLSFARYFGMAAVTLILDVVLLFVLVDYLHFWNVLAAAVAILVVFAVRFIVASYWIWGTR